jgi:uncharacterized delta-60 repeat protein
MKKAAAILFILILSAIANTNCPASAKSPDIDGSGIVDFNDFALLALQWQNSSETEPNVTMEWIDRYNGPINDNDYANDIAFDSLGNIYVTGYSHGLRAYLDCITIKYDQNGNQIWLNRYNGQGTGDNWGTKIAIDQLDNIYVTGKSWGSGTGYDFATIKYDPNGNQIWVARYNSGGNNNEWPSSMVIDLLGNIYLTGRSYSSNTHDDYITLKYDANGNQIWAVKYNGPGNGFDRALDISLDSLGNIYVTGESTGLGTSSDYATIKYDPNGNQIWVARYNYKNQSYDYATSIVTDKLGNIYVTGFASYDYVTIKYDSNGNQLWSVWHEGYGSFLDTPTIIIDNSGNLYIAGESYVGSDYTYAVIKYDPNGNQIWEANYTELDFGQDFASCITLDKLGNVYVSGYSDDSLTHFDYATIKYDPNGNQIWVIRYNGPGNSDDAPYNIISDDRGNIYVIGRSYGIGTGQDFTVIKYSQSYTCQTEFEGDLNGDCRVDVSDIAIFAQRWLEETES